MILIVFQSQYFDFITFTCNEYVKERPIPAPERVSENTEKRAAANTKRLARSSSRTPIHLQDEDKPYMYVTQNVSLSILHHLAMAEDTN